MWGIYYSPPFVAPSNRNAPMRNAKFCFLVCTCCVFVSLLAGCTRDDRRWKQQIDAADDAKNAGNYQEEETHLLAALHEAESFGEDARHATTLDRLALVSINLGHYQDGEEYGKLAVAMSERVNGPDHIDTAYSLGNLAEAYVEQRKYTEAEALHKRALAIMEKTLGPENEKVATVLDNLAHLYYEQGRYADADPLLARALPIWVSAVGPNSRDVAINLTTHAAVLHKLGRHQEATAKELQAQQIQDHPQ